MSVKEGGWGAKKELRRVGKERRATFRDTRKVSLRPTSRALMEGEVDYAGRTTLRAKETGRISV